MRRNPHSQFRRRNKLVLPRLQGGAAILIIAVVLLAGAVVALFLFRDIRQELWDASHRGHYGFPSSYRIVSDILVQRLLVLNAIVFAGGAFSFLGYLRRARSGITRLAEVFEASENGDLSSPGKVRGFEEIVDLGTKIDEVRSYTLALIKEVREDAEAMGTSELPYEEFEKRWEALKEKIGGIVP